MITNQASIKKQTAFRLDEKLIERIRKAAAEKNMSMNEFVTVTLEEATRDIFLAEQEEESRRRTKEFLDSVFGSWKGDETVEEIMKPILDSRTSNPIPEL